MHVAFLTWRDRTHPEGGGSEVYVEMVARELVLRGHRVTVSCAAHDNAAPEELVDGVRIRRRGGRLTVYPRALAWLWLNRRDIDVVVDVINGVPFCSPLVRPRRVIALVHHLHREQWRMIYPGLRGQVGWFVESRLVPRLYRGRDWLTVSDATARDLVHLGVPATSITVARNGLAGHARDEPKAPSPTLCVLARLVPHKQIEHALEVVARLTADFPDIALTILGEGWWRGHLEETAKTLQVAERVTFAGHVSDQERDRALRQAWVMLLPSAKEGWGLAIMEAALQETPTIAYTSAGGVTEAIVDDTTGRVVADLDEMIVATRSLLLDQERRKAMGTSARQRAEGYTWTATAEGLAATLQGGASHSP